MMGCSSPAADTGVPVLDVVLLEPVPEAVLDWPGRA